MARKQLLIQTSQDWIFGGKPTDKRLVDPNKNFILGLGDISKIHTIDVFDQFFTNILEEQKYEGTDILRMIAEPAFIWMAAKILLNVTLTPMQAAIYSEIYNRPFSILVASRGFAKSSGLGFILALKAALTAPLIHGGPGMQAIVVGSGFRQSKIIFEYIERLWKQASVLRSICSKDDGIKKEQDRFTIQINGNKIIFIPLGDGEKIRGLRCNVLVCDEVNSVNTEVFEKVVAGFTAVSSDPIGNVEYYQRAKYLRSIRDFDGLRELASTFTHRTNQTIMMGTAGHQFQPFYKYYSKHKIFIESKGDLDYIRRHIPEDEIPDPFNYTDYSICHIPLSLIKQVSPGFMDEQSIARSKATMTSDIYGNEYESIFTKDSAGFFKASVINKNTEKYRISKVGDAIGENMCQGHLFGIDVASEFDKFAVVVLAVYPNHAKVVNVWSTNRKSFEARKTAKLTNTTEYYSFCTRKIRELIQCYPPLMSHPTGAYIACDVGGGGVAIREAFHDLEKLRENERPIYEIIEHGVQKPSDILQGDHCLMMVNFSGADMRHEIYYGGRKTLEDGRVKFPYWDTVALELAMDADETQRQKYLESNLADNELVLYDTLEDTFMEIQRTIDELCSIKITRTPSGVEQFKAESKKNAEGKTVYMHKDRATALLLALVLYRSYYNVVDPLTSQLAGGIPKKRNTMEIFAPINAQAIALNKQALTYRNVNRIIRGD